MRIKSLGLAPFVAVVAAVLASLASRGITLSTHTVHGLSGASSKPPRRPPRPPRIRPGHVEPTHPLTSASPSGKKDVKKDDNVSEDRQAKASYAEDPSLLTDISFMQRKDEIYPSTLQALREGMGLQNMTQVQAKTFTPALEGKSIMARSRTGSGKTLAFLLPSLQRLMSKDYALYRPGQSIGVIILSPTRELAIQTADQAEQLLQFQPKTNRLAVACLYGGVKMQRDMRLLAGGTSPHRLPAILVATPGRLLDHLERNTRIGNTKFADIVDETKIVILDETDRLWETHQKETKKILSFLARAEKRQTLLFSATFPRSIRRTLKDTILKGQDVLEVDCIDQDQKDDVAPGNERMQQNYVVLDSMRQYIPALLAIIRREQATAQDYKILVFLPTSRMVRFIFQLCTVGGVDLGRRDASNNNSSNDSVWEIHSRMSQSARTRASNAFRNARRGILFSTDVSARGMDYPDVTLVVQMGAPINESQYIHRLGRSGRAGRSGKGMLVLLPFEAVVPKHYAILGALTNDKELASWLVNRDCEVKTSPETKEDSSAVPFELREDDLKSTFAKIRSGHSVLTPSAEAALKTFLVHYVAATTSSSEGRKAVSVEANEILRFTESFAESVGIDEIPPLDKAVASRLGL